MSHWSRRATALMLALGVVVLASTAVRAEMSTAEEVRGTISQSLFGDVYSDPSRWRPLTLGGFFSEGWDSPWVSPPNGGGGAPRQGWLSADDGVFYRLQVTTFGYAHNFGKEPQLSTGDIGDRGSYTGLTQLYLPLNQRFEFRIDIPFVTSNRGGASNDYQTNFGDFQITPRFILSETRDVTQSFNLTVRVPTGDQVNGNSITSVTPDYEFWANWWRGLVLRGGAGMAIPNHTHGGRTSFLANLASGYYFTPHDMAPFGDLVGYVSANFTQLTDGDGPSTSTLTFAPGFRDYLGWNWYLLGDVVLPATNPQPFDYQVQGALMWVF
jgi:hypothetical protein